MSERRERSLSWPLEPGVAPKIAELVAGLAAEVDAFAPGSGGTLILVELAGEANEEFLRLAERLAEAWQVRGLSSLVVDAHPAAPFTRDCFEDSPEGFTEILHYGLSPEAVVQQREGCAGQWIPAGGEWVLPLESPAEPAITLQRLSYMADRVLILADGGDAEGLLKAFRFHCHYLLKLEPAAETAAGLTLPADPPEVPEPSEPAPEPASEPAVAVHISESPPRSRRGRSALLLLLLIVPLGLYFMLGPGSERPVTPAEPADSLDSEFSPLPGRVELPYHGGAREEEVSTDQSSSGIEATPPPAAERTPDLTAAPPVEDRTAAPPAETFWATPETSRARAFTPRRRFESRQQWRSLGEYTGTFFIHVESYRDSALGAASAARRGFGQPGFQLRPTTVGDKIFHRLLVGPFLNLTAAAAVRDSLLDHTDEDYCTIVTGARE